mmetsp:Transcript_10729/g.23335  ORF Transcript_10729/g.23335 Transcript_10729/m.23335 type:complete len:243 (-) Transcript_10729:448-1176(-)
MMRRTTASPFLGLVILLAAAAAFTCKSTHLSRSPRSRLALGNSSPNSRHVLLAVPPQADDEGALETAISNNSVSTPSKYDDEDPRKALEQFGSLFSLVQAILLEGSTWDSDTLEEKTQEFVRTYLRVFVPGVGYAATSLAVFGSTFSSFALALAISGRGYADILAAVSDVEPLRALLEKADPAWGNAAIALIGCEIVSPAILAATLALTPKTMGALQTKLDELGWGEDDVGERAADILKLTG